MSIKCSYMVVFYFTVMIGLSRFVTSVEIPLCQEGSGFTAQSCCPCFRDERCTVACPENYLTIKPATAVSCERNSTVPATTTTPASDDDVIVGVVCLMSCPEHGHYDNSTKQCLKCNDTCLKCAWPDGKDCTVCKFMYNETCYSSCPESTVVSTNETQNGAKLCETKPPDDETKGLPIAVIAGGTGGVVVIIIIIIIIIIVCCCRRRRRLNTNATQKRAMSVILEQQQPKSGKDAGRQRRNYENTSSTMPQPIDIERQGDAILRYTRDPTFKDTNKQDVPESGDTVYVNAAMVRLATNTDLSRVKGSELEDKLEIEEIGVAPSTPVHTTTKRHIPRPVLTSTKQNLQPVATASKPKKGKRTVKAQPTQPDIHEPSDYLDMSHLHVQTDVDAGSTADSGLEVYENFSFNELPQGRRGKQASAHQKTSAEDGMEIYENSPVDQHGNTKGENSDVEDYENTKEFRKHSESSKDEANEDLDDYENMNDMKVYENHTRP